MNTLTQLPRPGRAALVAGLAISIAAPGAALAAPAARPSGIAIPINGGTAHINPATLEVWATSRDGQRITLSGRATERLGKPGRVSRARGGATWAYPDRHLTVTASAREGRLVLDIRADSDSTLTWPVTGTDRAATELQLPRGEGIGVPLSDPFWNSSTAGLTNPEGTNLNDLSMPFWGQSMGQHGVSYIVPTDIGTNLGFVSEKGRLQTRASHDFRRSEDTSTYTVAFSLTDGAPVAAAKDYRRWLSARHQLGSLKDKIRANPEVGRLVGALHAYAWGDGRTTAAVQDLRRLGISRMWLGYDAGGSVMSTDTVRTAHDSGYLVGPYDSWSNAQDPATADSPASAWADGVWPAACVHDAKGKPVEGFGGRGCYLSSQAMRNAEPTKHHLENRTRSVIKNGATSYFLDVDATGELFQDFSPTHRMTKAGDRTNRLARMQGLSRDKHLVLGSETAGGWANQVLAFSHGSSTPVAPGLWPAERNKEAWGAYWPADRPGFFFKPATLPANVARAMFEPRYRVPLYETVLHDSVVSVDRWELSLYKLPAQQKSRILLAMLYNTPLNLVLDRAAIKEHGTQIAQLQKFFAQIQKAAGTEPMTDFRRLTKDGSVQQTSFGPALTMTANFGSTTYDGVAPGCVRAQTGGSHGESQTLCP
ncbi:glycoside hydrolase [Luteipulveratus mongoliensis]|uniref:Lipoprotein n=1 Tax=Luteipulveratus mongoliensis TaxID=571913 RepID=A0A0K1JRB5_9MICO|nr:glycoside hydrolase [Luteipulveratus mongoliensis]AKU19256.1 lipoprotein [Luteipulveratus mongoliensis]